MKFHKNLIFFRVGEHNNLSCMNTIHFLTVIIIFENIYIYIYIYVCIHVQANR